MASDSSKLSVVDRRSLSMDMDEVLASMTISSRDRGADKVFIKAATCAENSDSPSKPVVFEAE